MAIYDFSISLCSLRLLQNVFGYIQILGNMASMITGGGTVFGSINGDQSVLALVIISCFHTSAQLTHFGYHSIINGSISQAEHKISKLHISAWVIHWIPIIYGLASSALQTNSEILFFSYIWTWIHFGLFSVERTIYLCSSNSGNTLSM